MANYTAAHKQPKETLSGDKLQNTLEGLVQSSEWFTTLGAEQQTSVLSGLRRISYIQAASVYASDAGKPVEASRIQRMDYETLAENYIEKKKKDAGIVGEPTSDNMAEWFGEFLARMTTVQPYTRNQTPHPNNFYSAEAMKAENELVDYLQKDARTLLEKDALPGVTSINNTEPLLQKLQHWAQAYVNTPQKPLSIEGEIKMSLQQSYQIYRSVPEHALAIQRVAEKVFGMDVNSNLTIDMGTEQIATPKPIREWITDVASQAIRNETWSPGDVDSKPHMRPAEMEKGILMGRVAIRQQYIHDLAKIGAQLDPVTQKTGQEKIQAMVWRLFNDVEELYQSRQDKDGEYIIERIIESLGRENTAEQDFLRTVQKSYSGLKEARKANRLIYKGHLIERTLFDKNSSDYEELETNFRKSSAIHKKLLTEPFSEHIWNIGSSFIKADPHDKGYQPDIEKLQREMNKLAEDPDIQSVKYQDIAGNLETDTSLRAIDALRMQTNSYGLQAQRITHRQSSEAYSAGIAEIHGIIVRGALNNKIPADKISDEYLEKAGELTALYDVLKKERDKVGEARDPEKIKDLQKEIHELSVPLTKELITFLCDEKNKTEADKIRSHIQERTTVHMERVKSLQHDSDRGHKKLTENDNDFIFAFESLEMARIGMYSGGAVARELIAEADKPQALWNIFAMQELMKDPKQPPLDNDIPKIVPLVEYVDDIRNLDSMIAEAYAFEPFRKAQEKLTDREDKHSFLKVWDEEKKSLRPMNVEDMLSELRSSERFGDHMVLNVLGSIAEDVIKTDKEAAASLQPLLAELRQAQESLSPHNSDPLDTSTHAKQRHNIYQAAVSRITKDEHMQKALGALVHYAEIMTAGSDATKSGSSGLYTEITDAVSRSRMELAKLGLATEQKSGNGSALYRAVINNAIMRMRQGLEMTQGPDILAPETERIRTFRLKRKMGVEAGISEEYRYDAALVNLNNAAGIKDKTTDKEYHELRRKDEARVASYEALYKDPDFSAFVDNCTPHKIQGVFKFAARPPGRLKEKNFSVTTMRAIGYGQALGSCFGQPHLNHGLAEHILGSDAQGYVDDARNKENARLYLASPEMQNEINRAVHDLAQFDPEAAWKNVEIGCGLKQNLITRNINEDGKTAITIHLSDSISISSTLEELIHPDKSDAKKMAQLVNPDDVDRIASCLRAAAIQDMEMTKSLRAVNAMMVEVEKEIKGTKLSVVKDEDLSSPDTLVKRLQRLSPQLGNELAAIRESQKQNRAEMTETFRQVTTGEMPLPKYPETYLFKSAEQCENEQEYKNQLPKDASEWLKDPAGENKKWYDRASQAFSRNMDITENALAAHHDVSHAVHLAVASRGQDVRRAA